jgi:cell wall-associated NlpC family hydrolase
MNTRLVAAAAIALLSVGCVLSHPYDYRVGSVIPASAHSTGPVGTDAAEKTNDPGPTNPWKKSGSVAGGRVADSARSFVGRTRLVVGTKRFNYDCSGTILAIYYDAGIDLLPEFNTQSGNGVRRLYGIAAEHRLVYEPKLPQAGDVIFWDNTYDRNGDSLWNDELTHAGIVISTSEDGQVEYVHHNYSRGIIIERMNLLKPDDHTDVNEVVNSPMRMRSHRHLNPRAWLASHLYRAAGRLYQL